jgi:hypothetical protein
VGAALGEAVSSAPFESYSRNGEDVVLWRALGDAGPGCFVDVGAGHPRHGSVSMAFYANGWRGITVEPDPELARLHRLERPDDVQFAVTAAGNDGAATTRPPARRIDALLSEAGWAGKDIQFMSVGTSASAGGALEGMDLATWRPWILVVGARAPIGAEPPRTSWEPLVTNAGYRFCLFEGLAAFYVADEHGDELGPALSYPACPPDHYRSPEVRDLSERLAAMPRLTEEVIHWRTQAMTRWATAVANLAEVHELEAQLEELRGTQAALEHRYQLLAGHAEGLQRQLDEWQGSTSWRVTRPLRAVSGLLDPARRPH